MNKEIYKLKVFYNDNLVGFLKQENNKIAFQYSTDWLQKGFSISPFSLPLIDKVFFAPNENFNGLFGVFYDSLPNGWGELVARRKMIELGQNYDKFSPLVKLYLVGSDSIGALSYKPSYIDKDNTISDIEYLYKQCEKLLDDESDYDLDCLYRNGGSSGGARPKANVIVDNEKWIIKFPCQLDGKDAGLKEYKANIIAKNCNIKTNEFRLFKSNSCSGFFGSKRFDYYNDKKIHMISLSSLLETKHTIPNLDYKILFQVIKKIGIESDLYEAYRRMCFNVIFKNKDDHGKNFSFIYNEKKKAYELSPFYDITINLNKSEHEMTVLGNPNPTIDDLKKMSDIFQLDNNICNEIINKTLEEKRKKEVCDRYPISWTKN